RSPILSNHAWQCSCFQTKVQFEKRLESANVHGQKWHIANRGASRSNLRLQVLSLMSYRLLDPAPILWTRRNASAEQYVSIDAGIRGRLLCNSGVGFAAPLGYLALDLGRPPAPSSALRGAEDTH